MNAPNDFRAMTTETIGKDLLSALVTEIKLLPKVWQKLSESKQNDIIDRLRARVEHNVGMAVHLLSAQGLVVVAGDLDQLTIKDGVKAVVKFGLSAPNLHELYDCAGKAVLVVVADAAAVTGGMDDVKGEADQRAMDLGHEYHDNDGGGMDEQDADDVIEGEALAIEHQPMQEELDQAYEDGYEAAANGKPESECPRMAGALCIQWVKGWKGWHEKNGDAGGDDDGAETDGSDED